MQFYYDLSDGKRVMAQVIFYRSPKDDRPGRLAYQGTILDGDKEIDRIVMEFVVGVPDTDSAVALADPAAARWLDGKTIRKVIVVPSKIVNIVVS